MKSLLLGLSIAIVGCGGAQPEVAVGVTPTKVEEVAVQAPPPPAPVKTEPAKPPPEEKKIAEDDEPQNAQGALVGGEIGESYGFGGLGLAGLGTGGGGRGEGIGLGSIGTLGHGAGTGTGVGFGSGHGRLGGAHGSPPQVKQGDSTVSGRLPPEVIRRIVRQNFGRYRLCYEYALRGDPKLAGKITVHFVIGTKGTVTSVSNGGSDLKDAQMIGCLLKSFENLTFPAPEGGIVSVNYPLAFSPGDPAPATKAAP